MYRGLARRLTGWSVALAAALLVIAAVLLSAFVVSVVARGGRESIDSAAREVPELVALYTARHQTLAQAAPGIMGALARPGVRVLVIDERHNPLGGVPPRQEPPFGSRAAFAIANLAGVRPVRVEVPGGEVIVGTDPDRLRTIGLTFLAGLLPVLAVGIALAWLLARYITDQALRPLVEVTDALGSLADRDFSGRQIGGSERGEFGELTTAYNRAAAQVSSAFEQRRVSEAEMRQFVADAGHELRTPLTVVMGYVDVLRKGPVNDPALSSRIFEGMNAETQRMRRLIDKLIVLARLEQPEAGRLERISAADVAADVVQAYNAIDRGNRIRFAAADQAFVTADATELHEAISNLVDNAVKYAPQSPIDVSVYSDDGRVVMRVGDHGPGLAPEDAGHIFDRFYRGANRDVAGSGLGLAIAKRAVERANGTIEVESTPGIGTQFTISLPRAA